MEERIFDGGVTEVILTRYDVGRILQGEVIEGFKGPKIRMVEE